MSGQTPPNPSPRDLVAYIADNLHRPLNVEMLAPQACLSPRQFARMLVRELGISPGRTVARLTL